MSATGQKEHFGYVFVRAVAYAAGFSVYKPELDIDSIDLVIAARGKLGTVRSPKLDLQVKCTATGPLIAASLPFRLEQKNYDELRYDDYPVPRILVVAVIPKEMDNWVTMSHQRMLVRHCAYWHSLRGAPDHASQAAEPKITVHLPRRQKFDVGGLLRLMDQIGRGEKP